MADPKVNSKLRVKTIDGATDLVGIKTIEVSNSTLTQPEGGVARITTGGGSGSGDVTGPGSATANNFASFDGATGKVIKDSGSAASSFATAAQGATADTALANAATAQATADNAQAVADAALPKLTAIRLTDFGTGANQTITGADLGGVILVDTTGGAINMQLTDGSDGFQCVLINTGPNPMSIDSSVGNALINGVGTVNVTNQYDAATIIFSVAADPLNNGTAFAIGV